MESRPFSIYKTLSMESETSPVLISEHDGISISSCSCRYLCWLVLLKTHILGRSFYVTWIPNMAGAHQVNQWLISRWVGDDNKLPAVEVKHRHPLHMQSHLCSGSQGPVCCEIPQSHLNISFQNPEWLEFHVLLFWLISWKTCQFVLSF